MKKIILALALVACGGAEQPPVCEIPDAGPVTCATYPWRWTTGPTQGTCTQSECPTGAECIVFTDGQVEHGVCE